MVPFMRAALVVASGLMVQVAGGSDLVLLDFSSPTCAPCQQMKPTIESLRSAGYPIRPVDVTVEPQLAAQYRVTQVPCFVLLADGQEVDRLLGGTTSESLQAMFQRAAVRQPVAADPGVRAQSPDAPPATTPSASPWMGVAQQERGDSVVPQVQPASFSQAADSPLASRVAAADSPPSKLISASVRIRVDDAAGRSFGTGTIIDARSGEALVVTCGHLFRESKGQGPVVIELFETTPAGVRVVGEVAGQVINYNLDRDVALVGIRPGRPVTIAPVAPPRTVIERGDRVVSVGCDHGQDPTALPTRVTSLDRYQGPPNIEAAGAPVEGRSGGGLFNDDGQLVGICFAADYEGNEGLYAAIDAIHDELDASGLSEIYQPAAGADGGAGLAAAGPIPTSAVVRGQEPLQPVAIPPTLDHATPAAPSTIAIPAGNSLVPAGLSSVAPIPAVEPRDDSEAGVPAGLSAAEQAAFEEITSRAATAEVICIIRPKQPGGRSEVITLDSVSSEFVEALARHERAAQTTVQR